MKGWFARCFGNLQKNDKDLQEGDMVLTPNVAIREVNVGEPVFSFVKCVQDNPKRFHLRKIKRPPGTRICRSEYIFTDKVTLESWNVTMDSRTTAAMHCDKLNWLTHDERRYVAHAIVEVYNRRLARLHELRGIRYKRSTQSERQRMMEIYCDT